MNTAYAVLTIERERGWGERPDGYYVFANEESARAYVLEQTKDRIAFQAPDYYIQYEMHGEAPCSLDFQLAILASPRGFLYVDNLSEMLWSAEQRRKKYST